MGLGAGGVALLVGSPPALALLMTLTTAGIVGAVGQQLTRHGILDTDGTADPRARHARGRRATQDAAFADAAPVLDLLATALEAGLPMAQAISAVTEVEQAFPADLLREVATLLALGAPPDEAWRPFAVRSELAAVAAAAVRSAIGGARVADAARETAQQLRDAARASAERAAARAGVAMTAPLALCFLPAFLCLGLIPVVIGLVSGLHLF
jgi:pilus assembly protein TadC